MARIVKGAPEEGRRIEAEVYEAGERARAVVAKAEADAAALRASAEADRDRLRAEAIEAGRAEGLARAAAALASAARERDRRLAAVERELLALAVDVARKILGRELLLDPAAVVGIAREALAAARGRRELTLCVNPADAGALRAAEGALAGAVAPFAGLAIREDAAVPPGSVVVETEAGLVDARLETQLAAVLRALEEAAR
jgi:type III secretion protein L